MNRYATGCAETTARTARPKTGGLYKTRTYKSWDAAIGRCHRPTDPSYDEYGARGIAVCQEWRDSFLAFYEHMGERPAGTTLDRIDNSKGYEPNNCRWATPTEQSRNRKSTLYVELFGERVKFMDACDRAGLQPGTVRFRLRKGYSVDDAFSLPTFKGGRILTWRGLDHE